MAVAIKTAVVRLDHVAVPTNDLGTSLMFYTDVLGAQFNRLVNCNLRGLNRVVPEMVFVTLANHHGMGLALQDLEIPAPTRPLEGPVCGFEIDERGIEAVAQTLRDKKVKFEGPIECAAPSPIAASIFLQDPQQNTFELSVRRDDRRSSDPPQGQLGLRRISHVRLEVTDLERARQWYTETLELEPCDQVPGERQLTFAIGETGQLFVLHEVPAMTARSHYSRGPHVDVKVPIGSFEAFIPRLANIERYWGPFGHEIPWHEPDPKTVYFYDPDGNRFQVSENRGHA
ncbi:MAG TPA: VOC family protein [Chloroflexota bacterium]|jgi:catechol 2,3-dioxygenase-like lactoylglutathione lyase family enzyme